MKFVIVAIILLVLGDMTFAHGANTAKVSGAISRFFHSASDEGEHSIFSR